jgi:hypothetical protein
VSAERRPAYVPAANQATRLLRALGVTDRTTVREILVLAVAHQLPPLAVEDVTAVLAEFPPSGEKDDENGERQ